MGEKKSFPVLHIRINVATQLALHAIAEDRKISLPKLVRYVINDFITRESPQVFLEGQL